MSLNRNAIRPETCYAGSPDEQHVFERKWEQMRQLRRTAWDLKYAAVKSAHPDWNDEQIVNRVREIFLYATT